MTNEQEALVARLCEALMPFARNCETTEEKRREQIQEARAALEAAGLNWRNWLG